VVGSAATIFEHLKDFISARIFKSVGVRNNSIAVLKHNSSDKSIESLWLYHFDPSTQAFTRTSPQLLVPCVFPRPKSDQEYNAYYYWYDNSRQIPKFYNFTMHPLHNIIIFQTHGNEKTGLCPIRGWQFFPVSVEEEERRRRRKLRREGEREEMERKGKKREREEEEEEEEGFKGRELFCIKGGSLDSGELEFFHVDSKQIAVRHGVSARFYSFDLPLSKTKCCLQ